jgi:hypothetical protein
LNINSNEDEEIDEYDHLQEEENDDSSISLQEEDTEYNCKIII